MQRAGGERMARGPARDMGQRPPAREIHGDGEHDDADGEGVREQRRSRGAQRSMVERRLVPERLRSLGQLSTVTQRPRSSSGLSEAASPGANAFASNAGWVGPRTFCFRNESRNGVGLSEGHPAARIPFWVSRKDAVPAPSIQPRLSAAERAAARAASTASSVGSDSSSTAARNARPGMAASTRSSSLASNSTERSGIGLAPPGELISGTPRPARVLGPWA